MGRVHIKEKDNMHYKFMSLLFAEFMCIELCYVCANNFVRSMLIRHQILPLQLICRLPVVLPTARDHALISLIWDLVFSAFLMIGNFLFSGFCFSSSIPILLFLYVNFL